MQNYVDENVLILGASTIPEEDYKRLAEEINSTLITNQDDLIITPANSPVETKKFVTKVQQDPDADVKIFQRALRCIDKAEFIIVDISSASTGMGLEVGYLLSKYPKKYISFIAKKGSKVSPHISGMYKHTTNTEIEVNFYTKADEMSTAVKRSSSYADFCCEKNY